MTWRKYLTKEFIFLVIVQYVGFKVGWLAAAWGAVAGPPWSYWGALPFFLFIGLHVLYYKRAWELWHALSVALLGSVVDTVYNATGFISYNGSYPVLSFLAPIWITSIWAGLAVTMDYSLRMLVGRPVWIFIVAAIFGPLAYWSGEGMGAIHFNYPLWPTLAVLAVVWGFVFIGCFWLLAYFRPVESVHQAAI